MLITFDEASALIKEGKVLHIAGDDSLLSRLPKGNWIGGTIPYFIAEEGGIFTKEKLYVNVIDYGEDFKIAVYGKYNVFQIVEECFDDGLTIMIMPYGSDIVAKYAKEAPEVEELLMHPTVGWIAGAELNTSDNIRVYDGTTGESYPDKAVVMFIRLPEGKSAMINIVNIFEDDKTDPIITFPENELTVDKCCVNGQEINFSEYLHKKGIDVSMPLVADYNGSYINVSIKAVNESSVELYAPVFKGMDYRFATHVEDYAAEFEGRIKAAAAHDPVFSCNCILNYLNGNLEGRKTPPFSGPVTFGEIAYQLINQTLVYCEIV